MKHIRSITVSKAVEQPGSLSELLNQIFGFVLQLVTAKGKTAGD